MKTFHVAFTNEEKRRPVRLDNMIESDITKEIKEKLNPIFSKKIFSYCTSKPLSYVIKTLEDLGYDVYNYSKEL
jgi:hypothetical protein